MENISKEEITKEMTEKLVELQQLEKTEEFLKNNINEFNYKGKQYRIHRPVSWEKDECDRERGKKYIEFLQHPLYVFKPQLVVLLNNKGVDILAMENEARRLFNQEEELLKTLAHTTVEPDLSNLKKDIETLRELQKKNFEAREEKLKYCIEKQLANFYNFYLLYLVLEVKNGDSWERVYKTYQDFQNSDEDIMLGRAAQVLAFIIYHETL